MRTIRSTASVAERSRLAAFSFFSIARCNSKASSGRPARLGRCSVTMGISHRQRLLVVVHVDDDETEIVRIVSARPADPGERREYEEGPSRKR